MLQKLPVDIQTFSQLREGRYAYVDKTGKIATLLDMGKYFFLSRPRRFGKSLFVTMLQSFFEGKKELFAGLAIEKWGDCEPFPVIHLDFSKLDCSDALQLERSLKNELNGQVAKYGHTAVFDPEKDSPSQAFQAVVHLFRSKTNQPSVLLVDEYDSPITRWLDQPTLAEANREVLRSFFAAAKAMDEHLRFVFITGVSKFAKVSVFSAMNNLQDITLVPRFHDMMGFTEAEIMANLGLHLDRLAQLLHLSRSELMQEIRQRYNGYSWAGADKIYNPFSVLRALHFETMGDYWFSSGTPAFLVKELRKRELIPPDFENLRIAEANLDASDIRQLPVEALLFQTGYLTITHSAWEGGYMIHTLNFPNAEVKNAFFSHLIPAYSQTNPAKVIPDALDLRRFLSEGNIGAAGDILRSYIAHIPGKLHIPRERYYQSILYMALSIAGLKVDLEKWVSTGILNGVLELPGRIYFMEFKFAHSGNPVAVARAAVEQIKRKDYALAWKGSEKKLLALGIGVAGKKAGFAVEPLG
jgi:hypothetical protein